MSLFEEEFSKPVTLVQANVANSVNKIKKLKTLLDDQTQVVI